MSGALLGAWLFTHIGTRWLQIVLALFLISTPGSTDGRAAALVRDAPAMVPAGLLRLRRDLRGRGCERAAGEPVLSQPWPDEGGDAGDAGRELAAIQLVKIAAYVAFGVLDWRLARHGLVAGAGAIAAIWLANPWLRIFILSLPAVRSVRDAVRRITDPLAAARILAATVGGG